MSCVPVPSLQVKLTAEPKKQVLEMLRKKIETQNNKVLAVRRRYDVAAQVSPTTRRGMQKQQEGGGRKNMPLDRIRHAATLGSVLLKQPGLHIVTRVSYGKGVSWWH